MLIPSMVGSLNFSLYCKVCMHFILFTFLFVLLYICEEVHPWALMLTKGGSGLLVYANSARKLDVKVWIKVVLIIPNCTEQGSVPPDMQEKKLKPFLRKNMDMLNYALNIFFFL